MSEALLKNFDWGMKKLGYSPPCRICKFWLGVEYYLGRAIKGDCRNNPPGEKGYPQTGELDSCGAWQGY